VLINARSLGEEERCRLLELLCLLPCAGCRTLNRDASIPPILYCSVCDTFLESTYTYAQCNWNDRYPDHSKTIISVLEALILDERFRRSKRQRLLMASLIRKVLLHINDWDILQFGSALGEWCLRSVHSSIRELRFAAAQALVPFIDDRLPADTSTTNRVSLVEFLRELSNQNNLPEQESLIFAWGLVGRYCGEKELNLVLLQLVEYLGHPQALVYGVAATELASLADDLNKTVGELLQPYWRSVAAVVVQDIFTCPRKAQQLADLLSKSVNEFLLLTEADTVPFLTLTKKKDILERIAKARGSKTTIRDLWLHPSPTLAAVTSSLLLQYHSETESTISKFLQGLDPDFSESDFQKMISTNSVLTACEILKASGDHPNTQNEQVGTQFI